MVNIGATHKPKHPRSLRSDHPFLYHPWHSVASLQPHLRHQALSQLPVQALMSTRRTWVGDGTWVISVNIFWMFHPWWSWMILNGSSFSTDVYWCLLMSTDVVYFVPLSFQSLARVYHCSEPLRNDKSWLRVPTYALSNANQSCQSGGICIPGPTHQGA